MGSEFFWFLDIFVVATAAATIFRGAKKGAVAVLISSLTAVIAFIAAFAFGGVVSEKIYDSFIRDRIEDYMDERLGKAIDFELIKGLSEVDMMKTKTSEGYLSDIEIVYDERNIAMLDLSAADLTETGIQNADLSGLGISQDFDWSLVKAGHITVTASDVQKYGVGNIVLANIITSNITSGSVFNAFRDVGDKLGETFSPSLRGMGKDLSAGSKDAVCGFMVSLITAAGGGTIGDRLMNDIIEPTVMIPLKAVVFCVIFAVVSLILSILANISKVINKVPIISSVNGVLGALLGLLEAGVILILVCMITRLIISLTDDSLVFLNEITIEKTYIFRHLYAFDPLTLLGFVK